MPGVSALRAAVTVTAIALLMLTAGCGRVSTSDSHFDSGAAIERDVQNSSADVSTSQAKVEGLLRQYGLHPDGQVEPKQVGVVAVEGNPAELYADASGAIGLDLRSHAGESAQWFHVSLRERTKSGATSAWAIVSNGEIIGAYLILEDSYPGILSLRDQSDLVRS